jgi:hypothetical protein
LLGGYLTRLMPFRYSLCYYSLRKAIKWFCMAEADNKSDLDKELRKGLLELEQQLEFYRRRGYVSHAEQLNTVLQQLRNNKKNTAERDNKSA